MKKFFIGYFWDVVGLLFSLLAIVTGGGGLMLAVVVSMYWFNHGDQFRGYITIPMFVLLGIVVAVGCIEMVKLAVKRRTK